MTPEMTEITQKLTFVNPKNDVAFKKIFGSTNYNAELLDHIPESATSPRVREAYQSLERHSWTPEELGIYDYWVTKEHARENSIETARLEGKAEGEAIGEARGKADGKAEIVLAMLKRRVDEAQIHAFTGLSAEEIAEIRSSYSE